MEGHLLPQELSSLAPELIKVRNLLALLKLHAKLRLKLHAVAKTQLKTLLVEQLLSSPPVVSLAIQLSVPPIAILKLVGLTLTLGLSL